MSNPINRRQFTALSAGLVAGGLAANGTTAADPVEQDKARLKEQAMKSEAVQAMLDVFAAEIRDAEEIP